MEVRVKETSQPSQSVSLQRGLSYDWIEWQHYLDGQRRGTFGVVRATTAENLIEDSGKRSFLIIFLLISKGSSASFLYDRLGRLLDLQSEDSV